MEIVLLLLAVTCILIGLLGTVLPILPGSPFSWLGLLLLHFSNYATFSTTFLVVTGIITLAITVFDYFIPSWYVQKKGGSKAGGRGALIGTFVGLLLGPIGIIIGPVVGAFLAELLFEKKEVNVALAISLQVLIGFLLSTGIKLIWGLLILWWGIKGIFF